MRGRCLLAQQVQDKAVDGLRQAVARTRRRPGMVIAVCVLAIVAFVTALLGYQCAHRETIAIVRADDQGAQARYADQDTGVEQDDDTDEEEPSSASVEDESEEPADLVVVDVSGAVVTPSVVTLPAGSRVADALTAAGGPTADADLGAINRAAKLTDGQKIIVPKEGEELPSTGMTGGTSGAGTGSTGSLATDTVSSPVNINTAGVDELDTLPGVGPSTAQAIVKDREEQGPFTSIEDIMRVSGIGEKKFENLKDLICV